jgi:hypothetical protein
MAAAKSENGDVPGVVDYTAHPPPPPPPPSPGSKEKPEAPAGAAVPSDASRALTPAQKAMHEKMLEHFQNESYKIPGIEDGELLEVEKFWLVRVFKCFRTRFFGC